MWKIVYTLVMGKLEGCKYEILHAVITDIEIFTFLADFWSVSSNK